MFTKKEKQFFSLANLTMIILILLATLNATSTAQAQSTADTAQDALNAAFEQYAKVVTSKDGQHWVLLDIREEGDWAYAAAQQMEDATGNLTESFAVFLASNDSGTGWYALAPVISDQDAYQKLLDSFPTTLIDDNTKAFFASANPPPSTAVHNEAQQATLPTEYHRLPFLASHSGYIYRVTEPGHVNQIDFRIDTGAGGELIVAAKSGQVVYVKQISAHQGCGDLSCWQSANAIVVKVNDNEYDWYLHIQQNSAFVHAGSFVDAGTTLARQGCNGYCTATHLHFHVSSTPATNGFADGGTDPNVLAWSPNIQTVDFVEKNWADLAAGQTLSSQNAAGVSVEAEAGDIFRVFTQGGANRLRVYTKGQSGWLQLDGVLTAAPDAVNATNFVDVYVRGLENTIWYKRYQNGAWSANYMSIDAPPGGAKSGPTAASMNPGQVDVFVRGADDALWRKTYANGSWSAWKSMGGKLSTGPDAASQGPGQLDVFFAQGAPGTANVSWKASLAYGSWSWQSFDGTFNSDPGATSAMAGKVDVFVRGTDQQLYVKGWNNGTWGSWTCLGGILTSAPDSASYRTNGHRIVFVRGTDNNIYYTWKDATHPWNTTGWTSIGQP